MIHSFSCCERWNDVSMLAQTITETNLALINSVLETNFAVSKPVIL